MSDYNNEKNPFSEILNKSIVRPIRTMIQSLTRRMDASDSEIAGLKKEVQQLKEKLNATQSELDAWKKAFEMLSWENKDGESTNGR